MMRIRKKDQSNLVRVGFFFTALIGVLMVMIVSIGKETSLFEAKVDIKARVANVSALKPGSYVELKGIRIGSVTDIEIISEDEVEITMTILNKELKWIKKDSKVSISTAGLVGDKFVEIYGGTNEERKLNPEKDFLVTEEQTDFRKIITKGDTIATTTDKILTKLDHILVKLGEGNIVVETFHSLNRASKNLESITHEVKAAKLAQSFTHLSQASTGLNRILTRMEKGPGTLNSLIYDDALYEDLRALLGGAQRNKIIKYYIRESIKNSERKSPTN